MHEYRWCEYKWIEMVFYILRVVSKWLGRAVRLADLRCARLWMALRVSSDQCLRSVVLIICRLGFVDVDAGTGSMIMGGSSIVSDTALFTSPPLNRLLPFLPTLLPDPDEDELAIFAMLPSCYKISH